MTNISIQIIDNADYSLCRDIVRNQQIIWGLPASDVMPHWKMMTLPSTGGFLIGAFEGDAIVGHAMLTLAVDPNFSELFLYLDMIGVLPDYQNRGIAENMLYLARERAMQRRIISIQWTFDPLEFANANLYLRKLGATAIRFYPDYYGPPQNENFQRMDRFWVKWTLDKNLVNAVLPPNIVPLNQPVSVYQNSPIGIELPHGMAELKQQDPDQAAQVSGNLRQLFLRLFQNGYKIIGFVPFGVKNYYIATRGVD